MLAFACDQYTLPLPPGHRFPMAKYAMLRRRVEASGLPVTVSEPPAATFEELTRAHDLSYVQRVFDGALSEAEVKEIGLPWSPALVERSRRSCGGTLAASRAALQQGVAVNLAGGTHHAGPNKGAGFCVFNDAAVAALGLRAEGRIKRTIIIDCDVHHGDGTAAIFANDAEVFTFSIHGAKNYPAKKPPGDLDVALDDGTGDDAYLAALGPALEIALARAEADLAIYLAGADPYQGDTLGRLALSMAGLARRDALVLGRCHQADLPVAVVMAGGYAKPIEDTVSIHFRTVSLAARYAHDDLINDRP